MGPGFSVIDNANVHIFINAPRDIYLNISAGYCLRRAILRSKYF